MQDGWVTGDVVTKWLSASVQVEEAGPGAGLGDGSPHPASGDPRPEATRAGEGNMAADAARRRLAPGLRRGGEGEGAPGPDQADQADQDAQRSRPMLFTVSSESEDRAGDVVLASGWELSSYERNPVVLWAHQHSLPPVGRSLRTWVQGAALMAEVEFAPTPFAQEVRRLYEAGFLRGVSVGFRALETGPRASGQGRGVVFKRQELLEVSAAPVPLHPYALAVRNAPGADVDGAEGGAAAALAQVRDLWRELAALV